MRKGVMVAVFTLSLAACGLATSYQIAEANEIDDCNQEADRELRIKGCSAFIAMGGQTAHNLAVAHIHRGLVYYEKGDFDRAIVDDTEAIKLDPKFIDAYVNRGIAYDSKGNDDRAIADYDKALEINPTDAHALGNRGLAYYHKGDLDRSLADLDRAIAADPNQANHRSNRGQTRVAKGDFDGAIADYDKAIELNPKLADAYMGRGWTYLRKGRAAQGLPDAEKSVQLRPDAGTLDVRGRIFEALGRKQEAIADYRRALAMDAAFEDAKRGLQRLESKAAAPASETPSPQTPSPQKSDAVPLNCRNYLPSVGKTVAVPCEP
jgi:tetratricopeptide (TPR) repeat protein